MYSLIFFKGSFYVCIRGHSSGNFRLPVPQKIGSASFDTSGGVMTVGPLIAANPSRSGSKVIYNNIFEYFKFLVTVKRQDICSMKAEDQPRAEEILSFVNDKALDLLQSISISITDDDPPVLLRCVLTHADLHNANILAADDGRITAVLDWELNFIQPAILAVDYPRWLSYHGPDDPRFADNNTWWEDSPDESKRFRAQFEKVSQS
jgi:hypothetical protein